MARKWTTEETIRMEELLRNGYTPKEAGELLGRSARAVQDRWYIRGHSKGELLKEKLLSREKNLVKIERVCVICSGQGFLEDEDGRFTCPRCYGEKTVVKFGWIVEEKND